MYSQNDLDEAVAAGALSAEAAASFRSHVELQRRLPLADEEDFRLLTGFNDIFVSIASLILLFSLAWLGTEFGPRIPTDGPSPLSGALIAAASWGLALFFTARRRMALPSIILLIAFVGGLFEAVGASLVIAIGPNSFDNDAMLSGLVAATAAGIAALGAWLHWRRFRVPITIAAGAAAVSVIAVSLLFSAIGKQPNAMDLILGFVLLLGLAVFFLAMRWDGSDPARVTRRSDVAFWLHLLAAPMIVHPIFALLGLNHGATSAGGAATVVLLYVLLGVVALAVDRRALLVSALAYVLYAMTRIVSPELSVALPTLIIGSALLLLSAFWQQARAAIVAPLPGNLRAYLPLVQRHEAAAAAA
ncbi:hypothetical protein HMF7854_08555 [Sphingomonas ginkgonis]|uniref:DUF2157 domain-containing protein n=1 Tax=Sphingomonas ginkgonis TaxID=2315330 RepID=A0A429VAC7_9SPHN|nr:hypothetical protein [Sphingomonas ginkgonis]RST30885.1 hypothetical protein HMF7854_08555 [Sphingomonas ginkgonis]